MVVLERRKIIGQKKAVPAFVPRLLYRFQIKLSYNVASAWLKLALGRMAFAAKSLLGK